MSMEEMDQAMMDMVNSKEPVEAMTETNAEPPKLDRSEEKTDSIWLQTERELRMKRYRMQQRIIAALWLLLCVAAVIALIVAQYVPVVLPWVLNIGVLGFTVAGALIIDRNYVRWLV